MLKKLASAIWGKFDSAAEVRKFIMLAANFCVIIGTYWTLRPIKDSIFNAIVGIDWQPRAKMLSLVVVIPLVILYSKLIDMFPRHRVFYVLLSLYGLAALGFAWFFMDPIMGLLNTAASPDRWIGWLWYVYVESFGSLIVALFWAITVDTTKPESASRGFPIIAMLGQFGNIIGPMFLKATLWGFETSAPIVAICGVLMLISMILMYIFMNTTPKELLTGYHTNESSHKEEEPGFFEGLRLLATQGYLLGIFLIIFIYEAIVTVIDFHFKKTASMTYVTERELSEYLSNYATMTGVVATLCVIFGVNNIQHRLGMRASLFLLPLLVAAAVFGLWFYPDWLNMVFWIMVTAKAINYALNQPTLKQLYIPTSKDTKYKAQAWIEMFGGRSSKAFGSAINEMRKNLGLVMFLNFVLVTSGGLILFWLFVAAYVARVYNKAIKENRIVC